MNRSNKLSRWAVSVLSVLLAATTFVAIIELDKRGDEYRSAVGQLAQIDAQVRLQIAQIGQEQAMHASMMKSQDMAMMGDMKADMKGDK